MSFSVTKIIYLSGRRHYGKRHFQRRDTRVGQGQGRLPESPGGHGRQPADCDIREGFTDYCLWSTFRPECIDIDGELDMECLDSGMVLFRKSCTPGEALESSYRQAFDTEFDGNDCFVILSET